MSLVPLWQEDGNNCLNPRQKSPAIDGAFLFQLEIKNILIILFISSTACSDFGNNPKEESELSENISFNSDIQPLLNANCINCHGSQGNLSERNYSSLMDGSSNNGLVVIPENRDESLIIKKLQGTSSGDHMPPEPTSPWSDSKIMLIKKWIDQDA